MNRRDFSYTLGLGLAAGWAASHLFWPLTLEASNPTMSIAFLADAHLCNGNPGRPEARALARAVAEIKSLKPPPTLVLFAGDLAHDGNVRALALGEEILSDLPMPVLGVRGEGDGRPPKGVAGWKLFSHGRFVHSFEGTNLLGLDTVWQDNPTGPGFAIGETQHRWLDRVLSSLDPARPLLVLSHAPLTPIFRPWGQWTVDSGPLITRLARFLDVLCLHGHVHLPRKLSPSKTLNLSQLSSFPASCQHSGEGSESSWRNNLRHQSLSATSWPLPLALEGTPSKLRPGLGPQGCGWALLSYQKQTTQFQQLVWQA